jgi:Ca2+-binding RTX toxin-like protein
MFSRPGVQLAEPFARSTKRANSSNILEALDPRRLLSVTVNEGYPGFYDISGDDSPNVISVSVSMADQSFTLDGATYSFVSYIIVHGFGGDDAISVISVDGRGSIGASLFGDDGNDDLTLNFNGAVWAGSGNDVLHLTDSFRGQAYGQDGNDQILVSGACQDPDIDGGDGDDLIDCRNNFFGVYIHGGAGNDTIYGTPYDDQIYGDDGEDDMDGAGGRDTFYARDGYADRIFIDGDDTLDADPIDVVIMKAILAGDDNGASNSGSAHS